MKQVKHCKVDGCDNKYHCSGYCDRHYQQIRRTGKIINDTDLWKVEIIPSKFRVVGNVYYLELYNRDGKVVGETLIDKDDYEKIKQYRFHKANTNKYSNYTRVKTNDGQKLHHLIVGKPPEGLYTDHINRNTFDNRKCNLRFTTRSQNAMNSNKCRKTRTSIYKGVHWDRSRNKWKSEIKLNGKATYIGRFNDEIEAAIAYDGEALKLFGREFAVLNIKEVI